MDEIQLLSIHTPRVVYRIAYINPLTLILSLQGEETLIHPLPN